jgi:hypothetical protein
MTQKYPNLLFDDNPPKQKEFITKLFWNREDDLGSGMDELRGVLEHSRILAVYGEPRCGKSHLVHRLLLEIEDQTEPYFIIKVNAYRRGTPTWVLENIFSQLKELIFSLPDKNNRISKDEKNTLNILERLINGEATELNTLQETGKQRTIGAKLSLLLSRRYESKDQTKWTISAPSDKTIVKLLCYEAELLTKLDPEKKVLLFVDDLDLLDRKGGEFEEPAFQLMDLLKILADQIQFTVIVTMRSSQFNIRYKDCKDIIYVKLMNPDDIFEVYNKHIKELNAGEEIFAKDALEWLEKSTLGRVGIFLRRCRRIKRMFRSESGLLTKKHVEQYVKEDVENKLNEEGHSEVMVAIIKAVRERKTELSLGKDMQDELRSSDILYNILIPIPLQLRLGGEYRIDTTYSNAIQEKLK